MSRYLCDTSCLVAAVCTWHEHHGRTHREIERRLGADEELVLAAHSLVETYAVLTRLPAPYRLRAEDALSLIESNWKGTPTIHLTGDETWRALLGTRRLGVIGGQTYDALIASIALKAGASTLLTWNVRNFAAFSDRIAVLSPP